ncbi:MAG: hypothetical protein K2P41_08225 [Lachnospiraceae bacterium]|nr:hypothetical protein [Lachnospiraceae bacterium]
MHGYFNQFLSGLDTALWSVNNGHRDVLAGSVFYKMGFTFLAEKTDSDPMDGESGHKIKTDFQQKAG